MKMKVLLPLNGEETEKTVSGVNAVAEKVTGKTPDTVRLERTGGPAHLRRLCGATGTRVPEQEWSRLWNENAAGRHLGLRMFRKTGTGMELVESGAADGYHVDIPYIMGMKWEWEPTLVLRLTPTEDAASRQHLIQEVIWTIPSEHRLSGGHTGDNTRSPEEIGQITYWKLQFRTGEEALAALQNDNVKACVWGEYLQVPRMHYLAPDNKEVRRIADDPGVAVTGPGHMVETLTGMFPNLTWEAPRPIGGKNIVMVTRLTTPESAAATLREIRQMKTEANRDLVEAYTTNPPLRTGRRSNRAPVDPKMNRDHPQVQQLLKGVPEQDREKITAQVMGTPGLSPDRPSGLLPLNTWAGVVASMHVHANKDPDALTAQLHQLQQKVADMEKDLLNVEKGCKADIERTGEQWRQQLGAACDATKREQKAGMMALKTEFQAQFLEAAKKHEALQQQVELQGQQIERRLDQSAAQSSNQFQTLLEKLGELTQKVDDANTLNLEGHETPTATPKNSPRTEHARAGGNKRTPSHAPDVTPPPAKAKERSAAQTARRSIGEQLIAQDQMSEDEMSEHDENSENRNPLATIHPIGQQGHLTSPP